MTKNEAASVAQMTDEQILSHAPVYAYNSDGYWAWQFSCDASLLGFARALLAQAAPPAAPVQEALTDLRDARNSGFEDCRDAIRGAIAFGQKNENHAPTGHWLEEFWEIGRKIAALSLPASELDDAVVHGVLRNYFAGISLSDAAQIAHDLRLAAPAAPASEPECNCNACYSSRMVRGTADPANCEAPATREAGAEPVLWIHPEVLADLQAGKRHFSVGVAQTKGRHMTAPLYAIPPAAKSDAPATGEAGAEPIYQEQTPNGLWSDVPLEYFEARSKGVFRGGALRVLYTTPPAAPATLVGMPVVVDPRLSPGEFEIREAASQPGEMGTSVDELASMTRMFHAACTDLGLINEELGLDPDQGGAQPILAAIRELKMEVPAASARPGDPEIDRRIVRAIRLARTAMNMWENGYGFDTHGFSREVQRCIEEADTLLVDGDAKAQQDEREAGYMPLSGAMRLVREKLARFEECAGDDEGCDIGREWFDALTTIGLLARTQRSPAMWSMTPAGEALLAQQVQADAQQDEREAFEAWFQKTYPTGKLQRAGGHDESYAYPATQGAWHGWCGRAAQQVQADAGAVYQYSDEGENWTDVDWMTYQSIDSPFKRIVYTRPATDSDSVDRTATEGSKNGGNGNGT